jgi:hypothetical protein
MTLVRSTDRFRISYSNSIIVVNQTGDARALLRLRLVAGPLAATLDVQGLTVGDIGRTE